MILNEVRRKKLSLCLMALITWKLPYEITSETSIETCFLHLNYLMKTTSNFTVHMTLMKRNVPLTSTLTIVLMYSQYKSIIY